MTLRKAVRDLGAIKYSKGKWRRAKSHKIRSKRVLGQQADSHSLEKTTTGFLERSNGKKKVIKEI